MEQVLDERRAVRPGRTPAGAPGAWTRDHILGLVLLGVDAIEREGQPRVAAELRHLIMTWYTQGGLGRSQRPARTRRRRRSRIAADEDA
ncbi:hypothetical protein [Alsobacter sp. R-9]